MLCCRIRLLLRLLVSVATASEVAGYRRAVDDLSTLAIGRLAAALRALDGQSGVATRNALIEMFPDLIGPYVTASGELAATWYEDLRRQAVDTPYYATSSGTLNRERVEGLVRFGVKPLFGQSDATALSLLGGGVQRLIADAGRDTIDANAKRDVVSTSWSRVARPGCCDFCSMLAGRGAVYRSKEAAGMVIGRGVDPSEAFDEAGARKVGGIGGGVKSRGAREVGVSRYHDFCRCTVAPTFYEVGTYMNPRTGKPERALVPISD